MDPDFPNRAKTPERPHHDVEFVLIAEEGILEAQSLLLCESIRCFAGAYSRSPITAVSPRKSRRPSASTIGKFERLGVEYLPIEIDSIAPLYGTSYRIHSLALAERRPGPPVIVQLDSDTIFVAEPDFSLGANSAAARPVDVKGMCTTGPGDPFDDYWRKLCALAGADYEQLPIVRTTRGGEAVRASYNGGLVATKRACDLFQRTEDIFKRLVAANMKPWPADRPAFDTGTGLKGGEATTYWGTSQAAFSVAAVAGHHTVKLLPDTHNFPLHDFDPHTAPDPARLVHIHYHWLFSGAAKANPLLNGTLELPAGIPEWLQLRLPLQKQPQLNASQVAASARPERKAILVLGMHRSGTSALGGAISALGAATAKKLMAADQANPRGYWESARLHLANDELLASAASYWHDWRPLDPQWLQSLAAERHRHKIKAILANEFDEEPLLFIKDPRICRFLPFIASILAEMEIEPVAFLPIRNPLEVAHSLRQRDGLPLAKSLLLWLRHVLDAEYNSRHMPRYLLRHEEFLANWRYHLDRAAEKTGVVWPVGSGRSDAKIGQFLSMDLHRQRASIKELQDHPDATPLVRAAYDVLRAMATDGDSPGLRDELDRLRTSFDESCAVVGAAAAAEWSQLRSQRDAITRAQNELRLERDTLTRDRDSLAEERDRLAEERDALLASSSWRLTAPLRWIRRRTMR